MYVPSLQARVKLYLKNTFRRINIQPVLSALKIWLEIYNLIKYQDNDWSNTDSSVTP